MDVLAEAVHNPDYHAVWIYLGVPVYKQMVETDVLDDCDQDCDEV